MSAARPQPKDDPSISAPPLGYEPVPDIFKLPVGTNFGACSSVAVNSKGHILVFHRSAQALMEFDAEGGYRRTLVQRIGHTAVLYRPSKDKRHIVLPRG